MFMEHANTLFIYSVQSNETPRQGKEIIAKKNRSNPNVVRNSTVVKNTDVRTDCWHEHHTTTRLSPHTINYLVQANDLK